MKRWRFWFATFAVSILNAGCFFGASFSAMHRGIEGVDNQAMLLFIPLFWIKGIFVIIGINVYTFVSGYRLAKNLEFDIFTLFRFSGLSPKAKVYRVMFMLFSCLLMVFGYFLFAQEVIWSVCYALSGGILLLFLYTWTTATDTEQNCCR